MKNSQEVRARAEFGTEVPATSADRGKRVEAEAETDFSPSPVGEHASTPPGDVLKTRVKTQ